MNISTSECSSGCESGWTSYWDQLSVSTYPHKSGLLESHYEEGEATHLSDEDLSMVSDASSGPPHVRENNVVETQHYDQKRSNKQKSKRNKEVSGKKQQNSFFLDDTASSPTFHEFSQDNATPLEYCNSVENVSGFSKVFSAAHFEGETKQKKHLGFFKSSTKGKSGSLLGRKRQ